MNGNLHTLCPPDPPGKVQMHPEDFAALLAWVRAKEERKQD